MGEIGEIGASINFWLVQTEKEDVRLHNLVSCVLSERPLQDWDYFLQTLKILSKDQSLDIVKTITEAITNQVENLETVVKVEELKTETEDSEGLPTLDPDNKEGELVGDDVVDVDKQVDSSKLNENDQSETECHNCSKKFDARSKLVTHLADCNPEQIDQLLSEEESTRKKRKHLCTCDNCDETFDSRSLFDEHLENCDPEHLHSTSNKKKKCNFKCRLCGKTFRFLRALEKHEEQHDDDDDDFSEDEEYVNDIDSEWSGKRRKTGGGGRKKWSVEADRGENGLFACGKCDCNFKVNSALERHQEAHDLADRTPATQADIEEGSGFKMIDMREGKVMRCQRCKLAFTSLGLYRMHMSKFHKKKLECELCSNKFTLPNTLIKHRLNYHTNYPKQCPDCEQVLTTKQLFVKHVNTQHSTSFQESNIPCHICGKLVKNKYTLKQHVRVVHEKKKGEFACDECGKVLKSKGSLDYHRRTHTGEFSYKCDVCGKGHRRYDKMMECLAEHQGVHKFQCPDCDYKCNQLGYYKKHLTTHSDAKPFTCPVCGHNSSLATNLNGHCKKVHKITLCQAEGMMKKNRFGKQMTEEELEQNRITLSRSHKLPGEASTVLAEPKRKPKGMRLDADHLVVRTSSTAITSTAGAASDIQESTAAVHNPWQQLHHHHQQQQQLQQQHHYLGRLTAEHQQLAKMSDEGRRVMELQGKPGGSGSSDQHQQQLRSAATAAGQDKLTAAAAGQHHFRMTADGQLAAAARLDGQHQPQHTLPPDPAQKFMVHRPMFFPVHKYFQ